MLRQRQRQNDVENEQVLPNAAIVYAVQQNAEHTFQYLRLDERLSLPSGNIMVALSSVGRLLGLVEADIERLLKLDQKGPSFVLAGMSHTEFMHAVRCLAILHGHLALNALPALQVPDLSHALYAAYEAYSRGSREPVDAGWSCPCKLTPSEPQPRMSLQSFARLCRDAGFLQPEGPLAMGTLERIWAAPISKCCEGPTEHMHFGQFLRTLAVIGGTLRAEVFLPVAALGLAHSLPELQHLPNTYRFVHYQELPFNLRGNWTLPHLTVEALARSVQDELPYEYAQFVRTAKQGLVLYLQPPQPQSRGAPAPADAEATSIAGAYSRDPGSPGQPAQRVSEYGGAAGAGSVGNGGSRGQPQVARGLVVLSPFIRRPATALNAGARQPRPKSASTSVSSAASGGDRPAGNLLTGGTVTGGWVVGDAAADGPCRVSVTAPSPSSSPPLEAVALSSPRMSRFSSRNALRAADPQASGRGPSDGSDDAAGAMTALQAVQGASSDGTCRVTADGWRRGSQTPPSPRVLPAGREQWQPAAPDGQGGSYEAAGAGADPHAKHGRLGALEEQNRIMMAMLAHLQAQVAALLPRGAGDSSAGGSGGSGAEAGACGAVGQECPGPFSPPRPAFAFGAPGHQAGGSQDAGGTPRVGTGAAARHAEDAATGLDTTGQTEGASGAMAGTKYSQLGPLPLGSAHSSGAVAGGGAPSTPRTSYASTGSVSVCSFTVNAAAATATGAGHLHDHLTGRVAELQRRVEALEAAAAAAEAAHAAAAKAEAAAVLGCVPAPLLAAARSPDPHGDAALAEHGRTEVAASPSSSVPSQNRSGGEEEGAAVLLARMLAHLHSQAQQGVGAAAAAAADAAKKSAAAAEAGRKQQSQIAQLQLELRGTSAAVDQAAKRTAQLQEQVAAAAQRESAWRGELEGLLAAKVSAAVAEATAAAAGGVKAQGHQAEEEPELAAAAHRALAAEVASLRSGQEELVQRLRRQEQEVAAALERAEVAREAAALAQEVRRQGASIAAMEEAAAAASAATAAAAATAAMAGEKKERERVKARAEEQASVAAAMARADAALSALREHEAQVAALLADVGAALASLRAEHVVSAQGTSSSDEQVVGGLEAGRPLELGHIAPTALPQEQPAAAVAIESTDDAAAGNISNGRNFDPTSSKAAGSVLEVAVRALKSELLHLSSQAAARSSRGTLSNSPTTSMGAGTGRAGALGAANGGAAGTDAEPLLETAAGVPVALQVSAAGLGSQAKPGSVAVGDVQERLQLLAEEQKTQAAAVAELRALLNKHAAALSGVQAPSLPMLLPVHASSAVRDAATPDTSASSGDGVHDRGVDANSVSDKSATGAPSPSALPVGQLQASMSGGVHVASSRSHGSLEESVRNVLHRLDSAGELGPLRVLSASQQQPHGAGAGALFIAAGHGASAAGGGGDVRPEQTGITGADNDAKRETAMEGSGQGPTAAAASGGAGEGIDPATLDRRFTQLVKLYGLLSDDVLARFSMLEEALIRVARQVDHVQKELERYTEAAHAPAPALVASVKAHHQGLRVSVDEAMARAAEVFAQQRSAEAGPEKASRRKPSAAG